MDCHYKIPKTTNQMVPKTFAQYCISCCGNVYTFVLTVLQQLPTQVIQYSEFLLFKDYF